ncbi:hypothetical protein D3C87_1628840 [compost metagenome]
MQLAGLNAHIMYRRRAVFQEFFIIGIVVRPPAGECVSRAQVGFGLFEPFFGNETDIVVRNKGRRGGLGILLKEPF